MGDRITTFNDCPKCGAVGQFECYEALSSNMKVDYCEACGHTHNYTFKEKGSYVDIVPTYTCCDRAVAKGAETSAKDNSIRGINNMIDKILDWLAGMHSTKPKGWNDEMVTSTAKAQLLAEILKGLPKKLTPNQNADNQGLFQLQGYNQALTDVNQYIEQLFNVKDKK